jgi:Tol biopolymer transport system component
VSSDLSEQEITAALERISASENFSNSGSLTRLLRHLVTAALRGEAASLKESVLGVEVFDRADFDPRVDPIVRVQAGRLRTRLAAYYAGSGVEDSVLIDVPKGTYTPTFRRRLVTKPPVATDDSGPARIAARKWIITAAVIACGGLLFAAWSMRRPGLTDPPVVYEALTSGGEFSGFPAVSEDGSLIAMAAQRGAKPDLDLYLLQDATSNPIRLTGHEANDYEPAFSPDGKSLAFRSDRDGGGIFVMPTVGSEEVQGPRLVAPAGRRPRFSPDGQWSAYWRGDRHFGGRTFIVQSTGGAPRPVLPHFRAARDPIWSADGKHLLLIGQGPEDRDGDWWLAPINGGEAIQTGVAEATRAKGIGEQGETGASRMTDEFVPTAWMPRRNAVIVALPAGESFNLWQVVLSPRTGKFERVERLTSGPGHHLHASISRTGRLVMANMAITSNIYGIQPDRTTGQPKPDLVQITDDRSHNVLRDVSADGSTAIFHRLKGGLWQPILREMDAGTEEVLSQSHANVRSGFNAQQLVYRVSSDGKQVAFGARESEGPAIYVFNRSTGQTSRACGECLGPHHWSATDHRILYSGPVKKGEPRVLGLLDPVSGRRIECRVGISGPLWDFQVSSDGKWLALLESTGVDRRRVWITPCSTDVRLIKGSAIGVTAGDTMDVQPRWGFDGERLYYLSERDGFRCLVVQRLDPLSKHPTGDPEIVRHFHSATLSLVNLGNPGWNGLTVTRRGIYFTLGEIASNVWTAQLDR